MTGTWTVEIPAVPDKKGNPDWLNENDRRHWAPRAELVKKYRQRGKCAAELALLPQGLERVAITIHVHKTHNRKYDAHNLQPTGKAIMDGLVDYGLVADDNNDYVTGPDMRRGEKRDIPGVTVTITEEP